MAQRQHAKVSARHSEREANFDFLPAAGDDGPKERGNSSGPSKQAYYLRAGMKPSLAARYYRQFGSARRILDVGCGRGDFGRYRPSPKIAVDGIDSDPAAVREASRFENAVCLFLDATTPLPYGTASFEGVLAKDILEHLEDPFSLVTEIHRVLEPGGVVLASVIMAKPRRVWSDYTHVRGFTERSVQMLFEDAGFKVEALGPMGGVPLSDRLHFMAGVPYILRVPGLSTLWASSWELRARKNSGANS
jgi:SAM-dependent methyltransferase